VQKYRKDTVYRTHLEEYAEKWSDLVHLRREDGILEMRFHWDNGPWRWNGAGHTSLAPLFHDLSYDDDTECIIMTGTGDVFLTEFDPESHRQQRERGFDDAVTYGEWWKAQVRMPAALMEIPVPIIGAVNGPAVIHPEIILLSDIVIAADTFYITDRHYAIGVTPSDGGNIFYRELLGHNRARSFLYRGTKIEATEALQLGLISEIVTPAELLDRAWQIAREVVMGPAPIQRRLTREILMQPWRELYVKEIRASMANESWASHVSFPGADRLIVQRNDGE
jgi:enoyl-CoA hydratase/carnithine racemase